MDESGVGGCQSVPPCYCYHHTPSLLTWQKATRLAVTYLKRPSTFLSSKK